MALARSSTLLRSQLRPVAGLPAPLLRRAQGRSAAVFNAGKEDLGGPGGQQPVPGKPGGPEMLKRNWMPIAGGAVALLLGIRYMTSFDKPPRTKEGDLRASMSTEIGYMGPASPGAKHINETEVQALKEMSGRKGSGGMGPFRAE
ncbi:hypothetical protein B0T10DRAFT_457183 [Thelonectria olida]|uniref:Uncharacterized protein n=1 Tax=Thelonectria olida TaxID=1576542 RepID=A0A9P9ARL1_9HYPO|nr:hypothetical protein B0T10DRAFT_457183 [Thelonectria olida]